jgi:FkbM family methyltransferase
LQKAIIPTSNGISGYSFLMELQDFKGFIFSLQNRFLINFATTNLTTKHLNQMKFLGNNYSGYWFPDNLINSRGTIWGVGLGFDSSFETYLEAKGFKVYGFEPELGAYAQATKEFEGTKSELFPWGLWDRAGKFESFGTSISIVNIFDNQRGNQDSLEIRNIHEAAEELELTNQSAPRVLKLNIEGAEREILLGLTVKPLNFEVIIFQAEFLFHLSFFKLRKKIIAARDLRRIIRGLKLNGYDLVDIHRHQLTFVRE